MAAMRRIARAIDAVNGGVGRAVAWLALAMVILELVVVVGRYVFGVGRVQLQETILYAHALLFLLAAAYTLRADGHVRVDVFYRTASARAKAWVNLVGTILFLLPVCVLITVVAWPYVASSWAVLERSRETSGLPGVFLLKSAILVFAGMIALQGVAMALRSILALRGDQRELDLLAGPSASPPPA